MQEKVWDLMIHSGLVKEIFRIIDECDEIKLNQLCFGLKNVHGQSIKIEQSKFEQCLWIFHLPHFQCHIEPVRFFTLNNFMCH